MIIKTLDPDANFAKNTGSGSASKFIADPHAGRLRKRKIANVTKEGGKPGPLQIIQYSLVLNILSVRTRRGTWGLGVDMEESRQDPKYFSVCSIYCWTLGCSIYIKYTVAFPTIGLVLSYPFSHVNVSLLTRARIFKKSMGARLRGGIGFSYRPARLHRLAEFIPWNQFRGPINI